VRSYGSSAKVYSGDYCSFICIDDGVLISRSPVSLFRPLREFHVSQNLLNLPSELDIIVLRPSDHVFDSLTVIRIIDDSSKGPFRSTKVIFRLGSNI
jgi:hypothetical protein